MSRQSTQPRKRFGAVAAVALAGAIVAACGDTPLDALGDRSSEWINEPEVVTTTAPVTTIPLVVGAETLLWANDEIVTENLENPSALISEVFARREGDRFIQASRAEIAAALPGLDFPARVPSGAEWVSSQLVIDSTGELSADPSAAFGIWSAEPYTRSRSVAQLAVLRVAADQQTALEIAESPEEPSCARFAETTTEGCDTLELGDKPVWLLSSPQGTTLVWFDELYRYELFGRPFVRQEALRAMAEASLNLSDLVPPA